MKVQYRLQFIMLLLLVFAGGTTVFAGEKQDGVLRGIVLENETGEPIPGATVWLTETEKGISADEQGRFEIGNLQPGTYTLTVTAVGYTKKEVTARLGKDDISEMEIRLEKSLHELDQVVVTGTMRETYVKDSPVKVSVVSSGFLQKNPTNNLMESISYINGLYNQVDCGVCSTNNIRINGMEGAYTAVLIDGMPIMGSLASVYGLNGLNPNIIESIEIIKGPNSTLYGSEAMGGVINIRTKEPGNSSLLTLDAYTSTHEEHNFDFSVAPKTEGFSTLFSGSGFYFDRFLDQNGDNFADATKNKRISLFNKWSFNRPENRRFDIALKYYYEDRLGGTSRFTKDLRGSDTVYGEAIETNRVEWISSYELPFEELFRLETSFSYHDQDSYYGDYRYEANQQVYFANLIWDKSFRYDRQLLMGGVLRYDALDQTFNSRRVENGSVDNRFIPGVFAQYEHIFSPAVRGLAGARLDHYNDHGLIFSPRLNLKLSASDHTTIRLNGGTGFRIVNLFTEEHDALTGSREVIITENLDPERSYNATFNVNQIVDIGVSVLNIDVDAFYTHFTNQIIPDYDTRNEIRYSNLDGYSVSRGISISAAHNFPGPLMYSAGVTFQDVFQENDGEREPMLFAPDFNSVFSLSYGFESVGLYVDYTGRVVGKMDLPEYPGEKNRSTVFTEQNLKLTKILANGLELYSAVKNLFNYTQKNPLIAPDRPFSDDFATDHVYGPLQARRVLFGIRYEL